MGNRSTVALISLDGFYMAARIENTGAHSWSRCLPSTAPARSPQTGHAGE